MQRSLIRRLLLEYLAHVMRLRRPTCRARSTLGSLQSAKVVAIPTSPSRFIGAPV
jgi:hypothetical protein